jgi:hypothetical protein
MQGKELLRNAAHILTSNSNEEIQDLIAHFISAVAILYMFYFLSKVMDGLEHKDSL